MTTYVLAVCVTAIIVIQFMAMIYLAYQVDHERESNIKLERKLYDLIQYMRKEQQNVENSKLTEGYESVSFDRPNGQEDEKYS
tara:strand:- start:331 stop:579 length:249 start_codon:yes stop_codon:yes gene_type:complete